MTEAATAEVEADNASHVAQAVEHCREQQVRCCFVHMLLNLFAFMMPAILLVFCGNALTLWQRSHVACLWSRSNVVTTNTGGGASINNKCAAWLCLGKAACAAISCHMVTQFCSWSLHSQSLRMPSNSGYM